MNSLNDIDTVSAWMCVDNTRERRPIWIIDDLHGPIHSFQSKFTDDVLIYVVVTR